MAGNERLSYEIAAIYSGSPEIQKAFKDFAALNAQGQKVVNQLDKLAKASRDAGGAIRESRQGAAQLGMQFNQLGTQVASGTSPFTAFAQQIGDVGYALSFMDGRLGKVGNFLAGPWGAVIGLAAVALAPFIESLFKASSASERLKKAQEDNKKAVESYKDALKTLKQLQEDYAIMVAGSVAAEVALRKQHYLTAKSALESANDQVAAVLAVYKAKRADYYETKKQGKQTVENLARAGAGEGVLTAAVMAGNAEQKARNKVIEAGMAYQQKISIATQAQVEVQRRLNLLTGSEISLSREVARESNKQASAADALADRRDNLIQKMQDEINIFTAETTAIGKAKNRLDEFNRSMAELGNLPGGQAFLDANAAALLRVRIALVEGADGVTEWNKVIAKGNEKQLPEWHRRLNEINEAYGNLNDTLKNGMPAQQGRENAITGIAIGELDKIANKAEEMGKKSIDPIQQLRNELSQFEAILSGGLFDGANFDEVTTKINGIRDAIQGLEVQKRNEEFKKSFDTLGQSVSEAFKGMLTAGASWKDGMKGIIQAVIDELWRLFVVQQIVGMVTNFVGAAFGGGGGSAGVGATNVMQGVGSKIGNVLKIGNNANGTPNWGGGLTWVGERGPELVNLPRGSQVIPAHRASQMGGGGVVVNVDARGSADPAAVRAQVQQGILEAAPAIIAAAEQRTVSNMRRPRLGGAMQ